MLRDSERSDASRPCSFRCHLPDPHARQRGGRITPTGKPELIAADGRSCARSSAMPLFGLIAATADEKSAAMVCRHGTSSRRKGWPSKGPVMAEDNSDKGEPNAVSPGRPRDRFVSKNSDAPRLPPQESNQPDPLLQLSIGNRRGGAVALIALICIVIIGVVLYGLNGPTPETHKAGAPVTQSAPATAGQSAPAGPPKAQADKNGHS